MISCYRKFQLVAKQIIVTLSIKNKQLITASQYLIHHYLFFYSGSAPYSHTTPQFSSHVLIE